VAVREGDSQHQYESGQKSQEMSEPVHAHAAILT
jgi:hypothetical protein